jgi:hypothetical protein
MKKVKSIKKRNYPKALTGLEIPLIMNVLSSVMGKGKGGGEGGGSPLGGLTDPLSKIGDNLQSIVNPLTGISTLFANAQTKKDENRRYIESIQPKPQFNTNEGGVNNTPAYFGEGGRVKYQLGALAGVAAGAGAASGAGAAAGLAGLPDILGQLGQSKPASQPQKQENPLMMIGDDPAIKELMKYLQFEQGGLSSQKAAKILHDGKVHGKKLTPKQRRFFGAMSNMQTGGTPNTDLRNEWNTYVDWLAGQGMKGKPELDKDSTGFKYLEQYRQLNPKSPLTKESIPEIQSYLQNYRTWVIENHKSGKRPIKFAADPGANYESFMPNLSKVDGYPGQYTTSYKFPLEYLNSVQQGFADMAKQKQEGGYVQNDVLELDPNKIKELQKLGYEFEFVED